MRPLLYDFKINPIPSMHGIYRHTFTQKKSTKHGIFTYIYQKKQPNVQYVNIAYMDHMGMGLTVFLGHPFFRGLYGFLLK